MKHELRIPVKALPTLPAGGELLGHGGPRLSLRGGLSLPLQPQPGQFFWVGTGHVLSPRIPFLSRELARRSLTLKVFWGLRETVPFSKASGCVLTEEATQGGLGRCVPWGEAGDLRRLLAPAVFQIQVLFVILLPVSWKKKEDWTSLSRRPAVFGLLRQGKGHQDT